MSPYSCRTILLRYLPGVLQRANNRLQTVIRPGPVKEQTILSQTDKASLVQRCTLLGEPQNRGRLGFNTDRTHHFVKNTGNNSPNPSNGENWRYVPSFRRNDKVNETHDRLLPAAAAMGHHSRLIPANKEVVAAGGPCAAALHVPRQHLNELYLVRDHDQLEVGLCSLCIQNAAEYKAGGGH